MIPKGQNGYIESKNKNYIYRIGLCKQELLGAVNKKYEEELQKMIRNKIVKDDIIVRKSILHKSLVKRASRKGAELNDVEKKNLNSFCSFIKKNIDISY